MGVNGNVDWVIPCGLKMLPWRQLIHLKDAELHRVDIAAMNFVYADGLHSALKQAPYGSIRAIDEIRNGWQSFSTTQRLFHQFQVRPAEYHNSADYFRALAQAGR